MTTSRTTATAPTTPRSTATSRIAALDGPALLRAALLLDAVVTGVNGAAYLAGATVLEGVLGVDAGPLRSAGAFLLAYGIAVGVLGRRPGISRPAAWGVVAVNAVWAVGTLTATLAGWGTPSTIGTAWVAAQALVVGGFAAVQTVALRRPATR